MLMINPEDPATPDASALIEALSVSLEFITGDGGKSSFDPDDVRGEKARFVIARTNMGEPVGCGAFRPLHEHVAEVKRMYAAPGSKGVGNAVLSYLEIEAAALGYEQLWLETRLVNQHAIAFYEKHGFSRIPNFGKYVGNAAAVCFAKSLKKRRVRIS
jgi:ribosomal protein S18 acetylase RimI-like enzyme